jgi:hypothetical protein
MLGNPGDERSQTCSGTCVPVADERPITIANLGERRRLIDVPVEDASTGSRQQNRDVVRDVTSSESCYGSSESRMGVEVQDRPSYGKSRA